MDRKKTLWTFFFLILIIRASEGSIGLGVWPSQMNITVPSSKRTIVYFFVFNPGKKELEVKVKAECINCERNIYFKGRIIGKISYLLETNIYPSTLKLEPEKNLTQASYVLLRVEPLLFMKKRIFLFYPIRLSFWIPSLMVGEKEFSIEIKIWSTEGNTRISVISLLQLYVQSIPAHHFILFLLFGLILLLFFVKKSNFSFSFPPL